MLSSKAKRRGVFCSYTGLAASGIRRGVHVFRRTNRERRTLLVGSVKLMRTRQRSARSGLRQAAS